MEARARSVLLAVVFSLVLNLAAGSGGFLRLAAAKTHSRGGSCVFDRVMLWTPRRSCQPHARVYPKQVHGRVQRSIYDAALTFGVPFKLLLSIARCESDLNPRARNGPYYGLFQFLPQTFSHGKLHMRSMTGIQASSVWRPRDASYVAGFMFAVGKDTSWSCTAWAAVARG
ncbi:MAG: transglycosylase SLT domain-containing protein [Chloroflexota bacterium]